MISEARALLRRVVDAWEAPHYGEPTTQLEHVAEVIGDVRDYLRSVESHITGHIPRIKLVPNGGALDNGANYLVRNRNGGWLRYDDQGQSLSLNALAGSQHRKAEWLFALDDATTLDDVLAALREYVWEAKRKQVFVQVSGTLWQEVTLER